MDTYKAPERNGTQRIVWELGGKALLSRHLGVHENTIREWEKKDRIPAKWQRIILNAAQDAGLSLKAEDLIG